MSGFCKALAYFLVALPTFPQTQTFVSITIKPARSTDPRDARFEVRRNGDLIARAFPAGRLLSYAYDLPVNPSLRISTLPDWTFSETYDIEAKAPADAIPPSLQDGEVRGRIRQMVRRLLADRFGLVMRVENKTTAVYALTVSTASPFAGLPTIFTVLGKLGLELKRKEDAVPVYTVERIERPAGN
ncbi:MAG TPA: TIGR03435 family protein [Bryobacteraceae bacterium]